MHIQDFSLLMSISVSIYIFCFPSDQFYHPLLLSFACLALLFEYPLCKLWIFVPTGNENQLAFLFICLKILCSVNSRCLWKDSLKTFGKLGLISVNWTGVTVWNVVWKDWLVAFFFPWYTYRCLNTTRQFYSFWDVLITFNVFFQLSSVKVGIANCHSGCMCSCHD